MIGSRTRKDEALDRLTDGIASAFAGMRDQRSLAGSTPTSSKNRRKAS
jgi:hypothetical protein